MTFAADIARFATVARANIDQATRYAVVLAAQSVIMRSPVGNPDLWKHPRKGYVGGRFRGNWVLGIGAINTKTTENVDPAGSNTLMQFAQGMANQRTGQTYYVTNSVPYAIPLEYGWSSQAPGGMVRLAMAELPGAIESYVASLNR